MTKEPSIRKYDAAGGVLIRARGEQVLVLKRPNRLDQSGRAEVRLPKGHIEPGESPEEAALREVREESGMQNPEIVAALGHQTVEFEWENNQYIREESYYLMSIPPESSPHSPEKQFERKWLSWEEALGELTFEAEREWVRRARSAWKKHGARRPSLAPASRLTRSQDISDQNAQQADDNPDVEQQISVGE